MCPWGERQAFLRDESRWNALQQAAALRLLPGRDERLCLDSADSHLCSSMPGVRTAAQVTPGAGFSGPAITRGGNVPARPQVKRGRGKPAMPERVCPPR